MFPNHPEEWRTQLNINITGSVEATERATSLSFTKISLAPDTVLIKLINNWDSSKTKQLKCNFII